MLCPKQPAKILALGREALPRKDKAGRLAKGQPLGRWAHPTGQGDTGHAYSIQNIL